MQEQFPQPHIVTSTLHAFPDSAHVPAFTVSFASPKAIIIFHFTDEKTCVLETQLSLEELLIEEYHAGHRQKKFKLLPSEADSESRIWFIINCFKMFNSRDCISLTLRKSDKRMKLKISGIKHWSQM